jgi:hypothetical protein
MLKTFIGTLSLGVVLSFHEHLYAWALLPLAICGAMLAVGLMIERKQ